MKKALFRGSSVAIVTPFSSQGQVDFTALGRLIDWLIEQDSDCITICGTTGESSTMTDKECLAAIKYTVDRVAGRIPVIAGTGRNDTRHALELSIAAEELGADGLLLVTPYYNKTTQKGLIAHFTHIADRVKTPILLYNVPARTGMSVLPETYAALAAHPNIAGTKEASGDLGLLLKTRHLCGEEFALYSGNDDQIIPILAMGGKGVISVLANVAPRAVHQMCSRFFSGDVQGAMELQMEYANLIDVLFCETSPIPVKTALHMMDLGNGVLRLPLVPMSEKNRLRLYQELNALGMV